MLFRSKVSELQLEYEVLKPSIRKEEPLKVELNHFLECISKDRKPISDGRNGLENLKIISKK